MKINRSALNDGRLLSIQSNENTITFNPELGPAFYEHIDGKKSLIDLSSDAYRFTATRNQITYSLSFSATDDYVSILATITNHSNQDYRPDSLGLKLGIDTYMIEYPQWNYVYFPTMLRCEKTHFWGYFMSPLGRVLAITCDTPVASWELDYTKFDSEDIDYDYGHRIHTANLILLSKGPQPERHPQDQDVLKAGASRTWDIKLMPLEGLDHFQPAISDVLNIPSLNADRYTFSIHEEAQLSVNSAQLYSLKTTTPSGIILEGERITLDEYGVYTTVLTTADKKQVEAKLYCRKPYDWYLDRARENAIKHPQKASTHTESWYGHFSAFLAKKHNPNPELDRLAQMNFDEIMPLMYDFEKGEAIIIPRRIQNIACLIGLLVDIYDSDPLGNQRYLEYANKMADKLMEAQHEDGAFYSGDTHYTCVIYIAKSMLELALCEQQLASDPIFQDRYKRHYASAKKAVDNLVLMLETIGTEGEHTLEDGMISCSALQIAYFALTLPVEERGPYITAAEHMISLHRCLEQNIVPDARMHGATLRFWEAQYDVMIRGNMLSSPHGWTSWKSYATYYLYLLTGEVSYLVETINSVGACIQTIDESGTLRWAFVVDPIREVKVMVPDLSRESPDAYASATALDTKAYRAQYEKRTIGEQYVDMISSWYRPSPAAPMTGGYETCPLIFDGYTEDVDTQGGSCDNDVHEHFKCLEETLLGKAFVIVSSDRDIESYNCGAELRSPDSIDIQLYENCHTVHFNLAHAVDAVINGCTKRIEAGLSLIPLSEFQ